jgi:hypothetical protein
VIGAMLSFVIYWFLNFLKIIWAGFKNYLSGAIKTSIIIAWFV